MEFVATAPAIAEKLEKSWKIRPESALKNDVIDEVIQFLTSRFDLGPSVTFKYRLCLDEAITNAITHGCRGVPNGTVDIDFHFSPAAWAIRIEDPGPGFDRSRIPDPGDPRNDYRETGRGILILERYTDRLVYAKDGREQILWMKTESMPAAN